MPTGVYVMGYKQGGMPMIWAISLEVAIPLFQIAISISYQN